MDNQYPKNKEEKEVQPHPLTVSPDLTFLWRLRIMMESAAVEGFEGVISWTQNGTVIKVHDNNKFEETVLPRFFLMKKYNSFTRQLHAYGFKHIREGSAKGGYYNPKFTKDDNSPPSNFMAIKRKPSRRKTRSRQRDTASSASGGKQQDCEQVSDCQGETEVDQAKATGSPSPVPRRELPLASPDGASPHPLGAEGSQLLGKFEPEEGKSPFPEQNTAIFRSGQHVLDSVQVGHFGGLLPPMVPALESHPALSSSNCSSGCPSEGDNRTGGVAAALDPQNLRQQVQSPAGRDTTQRFFPKQSPQLTSSPNQLPRQMQARNPIVTTACPTNDPISEWPDLEESLSPRPIEEMIQNPGLFHFSPFVD